jgi:hypothetical protein
MNQPMALLVLTGLAVAACSTDDSAPLEVGNVSVFAPLPGRSATVAYLDIRNRSRKPVTIARISCAGFDRAEMHETTVTNGVASMHAVPEVRIDAGAILSFEPGGMHIMLIDPVKSLLPGNVLQLEIHYDDGGLLIVEAPVRTRLDATNGNRG